jgi:hypothetical protein
LAEALAAFPIAAAARFGWFVGFAKQKTRPRLAVEGQKKPTRTQRSAGGRVLNAAFTAALHASCAGAELDFALDFFA